MNSRYGRQGSCLLGFSLILFLVQLPICAQDPGSRGPPPSGQGTGTQLGDKNQQPADDSNPAPPIAPAQVLDTTPVVREVGSAQQLGPSTSPLRGWGPLYVASAEALMAYDNLAGTGSTLSSSGR